VDAAVRALLAHLFHLLGYVWLFFSTVLVLRVVIAISREGT
jgi:hypothetical protein